MKKPWDKKALVAKLKENGLDIAEETVMLMIDGVFDWAEESIKLTPNKLDDLALPVLKITRTFLKKKADQIDGEIG